jgi:hypothetical protein
MKKFIIATLWVVLATALPSISKAQDTSTIEKLLTYTIAPLDKSQIPTQYLAEKGTIFLGMNTFNGTLTDDNVFVTNLWRMMYVQLQESYVGSGTNPLPNIISVNNALQNNTIPNQPTPVPILIGQYNSMDDEAINNGLLTYNSYTRQLNDVPNRPSSPYLTKNLFAACPVENFTITGMANIIVKSSLNFNNTGATLSSIQIDFANGQGFVNIPLDVAVTASYADTGYYRWTIKVTLSNNTVLQCYADYYVEHVPSTSNTTTYSYSPSGPNGPVIPTWGTIASVSGVHSGATIHIIYSNKNRSNTLRKPLIVVENMDAFNLAPQVQNRPFGITEFLKILDEPLPTFNFNSQLDDIAGYDLVFIDFEDGMDGIVRNAAVVQEAINRVNANKVFDNRSGQVEQNVVLGIGTGGLNARYALANMAKNFSGSNTRLLITHDAPHRGQNIAIGLQYLVKFINKSTAYTYNLGDVFPEHAQTLVYFKSKVCKDVLIYQTSDNDNSVVVNNFIDNVYQPMVTFASNTQPYKFVATSLGNECARPLFDAGRRFMDFGSEMAIGFKIKVSLSLLIGRNHRLGINLFSIPVSELKYETVVFARSIPNQTDPLRLITAFTHLYKITLLGTINLLKNGVEETASAPTNLLPIDGVPGSFITLMDFRELRLYQNTFGNFYFSYEEENAVLFKIPIYKLIIAKFSLYEFFKTSMYNSGIFTTQYTSLPIGSALDVSPFNENTFSEKYVYGVNANYPSKSSNFIAQETVQSQRLYNNASMRFTARNARFLFNEMENLVNTENCSSECSPEFSIAGSGTICNSSETYSLTPLPPNATVTWTVLPANNAVTLTTLNNQVTLQRNAGANEKITLTATISNACGAPFIVNKVIIVGTERPSDYGICGYNPNDGCRYPKILFAVHTAYPAGTTFKWFINNVLMATTSNSSWTYNLDLGDCDSYMELSVIATTTCGDSYPAGEVIYYACESGFARFLVSPNPTSGDIEIEDLAKDKTDKIKEIQITDKFGNIKKKIKILTNNKKQKINITELPADMYIIHIYDGKTWVSKKVIKK